jgi:hypothetical protein
MGVGVAADPHFTGTGRLDGRPSTAEAPAWRHPTRGPDAPRDPAACTVERVAAGRDVPGPPRAAGHGAVPWSLDGPAGTSGFPSPGLASAAFARRVRPSSGPPEHRPTIVADPPSDTPELRFYADLSASSRCSDGMMVSWNPSRSKRNPRVRAAQHRENCGSVWIRAGTIRLIPITPRRAGHGFVVRGSCNPGHCRRVERRPHSRIATGGQ